jgi:aminoglycoside 6-adenylyltransferase
MDQHAMLDSLRSWASEDDNIRLVVLTGSFARGDAAADALSDLDVELYVLDPMLLLEHRDWYGSFGQVLVVEELENPDWHPTRLIYYDEGKIDFMIADVDAAKGGVGYARPYRILIDKDGFGHHLHAEADPASHPPTATEVETCIHWFFAAALMWAKAVVRREPWSAKVREWEANNQLLQMIEWDHRSRYGWNYDTWFLGAHMYEWMDADIVARLGECWADFTTTSMASAVAASVGLFDELMMRTSHALGLDPFDSRAVRERVARTLRLARFPGLTSL